MPDGADLDRACRGYASALCPAIVYGAGLVAIEGPSREILLDHAATFLEMACYGLTPRVVSLRMTTPDRRGAPGGRDSWTAVVGATVAFFPGAREPHVAACARAPPLVPCDSDERVDEPMGSAGGRR